MMKKVLKTKDRKNVIRVLKTKLSLSEKLNREYYERIKMLETEKYDMLWFIRCYGNYIMKHGTERDKNEFKRLMKTVGGDDARWL